MPSYKYSCLTGCQTSFNKLLKISERNIPTEEACPSCGKKTIEKICEAPLLADPYRISGTNSSKVPGDMVEIFKRIGQTNYGSELATKYA